MAPSTPRKAVPKDRFSALFSTLKTQTYYDPSTRGAGSHTSVPFQLPPSSSHLPSPPLSSQDPDPDAALPPSPQLTPPLSSIRTIAWNPTGHLIATGSQDRTLRIWNPDKPQVKNSTELRGHAGAVERVAWNPVREAELASVSTDGTCRFWDVRSKGCVATVQMGGRGLSLSWAPDGRMVLLGKGDKAVREGLLYVSLRLR